MQSVKDIQRAETTASERAKGAAVEQVRFVWARRKFLTSLALLAAVVSSVVALLLPPRFESTVRLIPSEPPSIGLPRLTGALSGLAGIAGVGAGMDALGLKSQGAKFVGMLHSRSVADRLIDRFDLMKVYHAKLREDARRALDERTIIIEDRKTGIISVSVQDRDRHRAAQIAQAYADELDRLNSELNMTAAHRERQFLEDRLAEVKKQLSDSAQRLADFSSKNTMLSVDIQAKAMVEAAANLQGQIAAREASLAGMEQIYNPNSQRIQTIKAQITELKRQLKDVTGRQTASASTDDLFPPIRQLPKLGVEYTDLYRENRVNNAVFEVITQQLEMAKIEEAKELPTVKVMDPADVPERRVFPKRTMIVMLSTAAAFLFGLIWIYAKRKWDLTDDDDPVKQLMLEASGKVVGRRFKVRAAGSDGRL
jgi:uncharacterized protein involved in exopolysaccharide biosynthesis